MGFFSGIKKLGKSIKHTAKKVGKGIHKGIKWGKKQLSKAKSIPVVGDAIRAAEDFTPLGQIEAGIDGIDDLTQGNLKGALHNAARAGVPEVGRVESAVDSAKRFRKGDIQGGVRSASQAAA